MKYYYVHIWYTLDDSSVLYYNKGLYDHDYTGGSENAIEMIEYHVKKRHGSKTIHVKRSEVETLIVDYEYV
jgi:hypothetical protein